MFFSWWFTMVQPVQNHEINKHNTSSWLKQPMNENSAKVKLDHAPISINFYQFFFELWGTWFERQGFGWGMVSTDSMGVAAFQQRTSRANTKNFSIFLGEKNMFFFLVGGWTNPCEHMSQNGNLPQIRGENKPFETTTKFLGIPMFN